MPQFCPKLQRNAFGCQALPGPAAGAHNAAKDPVATFGSKKRKGGTKREGKDSFIYFAKLRKTGFRLVKLCDTLQH